MIQIAPDKRVFALVQLSCIKLNMSDRLPPLTALRAFEAAARHMSFAKAAAELFVTPAALSYQIKALETELGQPLFHRLNRAVSLTEAGRALAPGTAEAFTMLMASWRKARKLNDNGVLTVTAGPAFTSKWLAPRLYDFAQQNPDIELRFAAGLRIADFDRDEVDVAIRFSVDAPDDLFSEPLIDEWLTPMMTPQLAETIEEPSDLINQTLIHDDSIAFVPRPCDWAAWAHVSSTPLDTTHGPRFSQADHALDAAMSGAGVVLGRVSLATRALEAGRLVAPFSLGLITKAKFRFVCQNGNENRPNILAFRHWVFKEIAASRAFEAGRNLVKVGADASASTQMR